MPKRDSPERSSLSALGPRVRSWRARRGMTQRQLAEGSGLSLRFLADVEAGKGNASLVSMQAMAGALGIALTDMLQDVQRPALRRVQRLLVRLDDAQLDQAHRLLEQSFPLGEPMGRERRIALIGLRGAGKSTLGAELARMRSLPFIELDREMEREAGTGMGEILLLHGQEGYRRFERRALQRVAEEHAAGVVMTTGGSIVSEAETLDLLLANFYCVWIKASPEEHVARVVAQGDFRPFGGRRPAGDGLAPEAMSEALKDIRGILGSRDALYARADSVVDTSGRKPRASLRDLEKAVPAPGPGRWRPVEADKIEERRLTT